VSADGEQLGEHEPTHGNTICKRISIRNSPTEQVKRFRLVCPSNGLAELILKLIFDHEHGTKRGSANSINLTREIFPQNAMRFSRSQLRAAAVGAVWRLVVAYALDDQPG
jgi:hypothetical protein